jgi:hypothetical protein
MSIERLSNLPERRRASLLSFPDDWQDVGLRASVGLGLDGCHRAPTGPVELGDCLRQPRGTYAAAMVHMAED